MSQYARLPSVPASISGTVDVNLKQVGGVATSLGQKAMTASLPVVIASDQSTIAVSAASLPLPSGAATEATLSAMSAKLPAALGQTTMAASMSVAIASNQSALTVSQATAANLNATVVGTGTFAVQAAQSGTWNINNISGTVSLPTGAATAAKQPALGTAGSASADVISIQGIASMVAVQVDSQKIAGNTVSTGNGVVGTGVQRVAIASDNTAFSVNAQVIPQSSSTNAASSLASTALEASHVIKASAGRLLQLTGVNTKSSGQYIQVFNSTTVPADATAPVLLCYVPANANFSFDFGPIGRYFSTGIAVSNSSTAATKTIGSADCWFNAEYL